MLAYRFLSDDDTSAFCHRITEALSKGWSLQGNPVYTFDAATGKMRCGQAVVKQSDREYDAGMKLGEL